MHVIGGFPVFRVLIVFVSPSATSLFSWTEAGHRPAPSLRLLPCGRRFRTRSCGRLSFARRFRTRSCRRLPCAVISNIPGRVLPQEQVQVPDVLSGIPCRCIHGICRQERLRKMLCSRWRHPWKERHAPPARRHGNEQCTEVCLPDSSADRSRFCACDRYRRGF